MVGNIVLGIAPKKQKHMLHIGNVFTYISLCSCGHCFTFHVGTVNHPVPWSIMGLHYATDSLGHFHILLMAEILHQLIGSFSPYLQVLCIPGGAGFVPATVWKSFSKNLSIPGPQLTFVHMWRLGFLENNLPRHLCQLTASHHNGNHGGCQPSPRLTYPPSEITGRKRASLTKGNPTGVFKAALFFFRPAISPY